MKPIVGQLKGLAHCRYIRELTAHYMVLNGEGKSAQNRKTWNDFMRQAFVIHKRKIAAENRERLAKCKGI